MKYQSWCTLYDTTHSTDSGPHPALMHNSPSVLQRHCFFLSPGPSMPLPSQGYRSAGEYSLSSLCVAASHIVSVQQPLHGNPGSSAVGWVKSSYCTLHSVFHFSSSDILQLQLCHFDEIIWFTVIPPESFKFLRKGSLLTVFTSNIDSGT